jgi:GGDEF domain-containing protein
VLISPRGEDGSPNGLSPATRREMLRRVAARVRDRVDQRDTVVVLRHDLFGVILSAVPGPREASEVAGRLARAVSAPFSVPGAEVAMTCLVGVATSADGEGPIDARSLVGRAVASLRHTGTARAANGLWPEAASVGLPPAGEPFSATA